MSSSESSELVQFTSIECELSFPLSLQDMCKVHILLRFEEFPVETLALLPLKIRRKLFLALSHADLLTWTVPVQPKLCLTVSARILILLSVLSENQVLPAESCRIF